MVTSKRIVVRIGQCVGRKFFKNWHNFVLCKQRLARYYFKILFQAHREKKKSKPVETLEQTFISRKSIKTSFLLMRVRNPWVRTNFSWNQRLPIAYSTNNFPTGRFKHAKALNYFLFQSNSSSCAMNLQFVRVNRF